MKKRIWIVFCIIIFGLVLAASGVALAQNNKPSTSIDVELGEPGLSYVYNKTIGETGVPYVVDTQHFNVPFGLFIDSADNLFVSEEFGARVLEYASSGEHLLTLGVAGQPWHHDNFLANPKDVAIDDSGRIWVVFHHAVKAFDNTGQALLTLPESDPWNVGNEHGQFDTPEGITFDNENRMYVGDANNCRVEIFTFDIEGTPTYSDTIGITDDCRADQLGFNYPTRLEFDSLGRLFVLDSWNSRIQRCEYTDSWTCSTHFGESGVPGSDLEHLYYPRGMAIDTSDNVFISDSDNQRILKCSSAGVCELFAGETGVTGSDNLHFDYPTDVVVDSVGLVYVSDYANHRVQVFINDGTYIETRGETGVPYLTDSTHLYRPWGIYLYDDGSMLVNESSGYRMVKLDDNGQVQWGIGVPGVWGNDNEHFGCYWGGVVSGPAVDAEGNIYVPDVCNHRIQVFTSGGSYLYTFGNYGQGQNEFDGPRDIEIDSQTGNIYVVDHWNQRVQVYASDWSYLTTIGVTGEEGDDNLHLRYPWGIALDSNGIAYIADSDNQRVQKCTITGTEYTCATLLGETGIFDDSFGHLHPLDLDIDAVGNIYVADEWNNRVQIFDPQGKYLTTIGGAWESTTGGMIGPSSIAVADDGTVYISDRDNHRIQVFTPGFPGWKQVNINGFGDRNLEYVSTLATLNNQLYAASWVTRDGYSQIWRSSDGKTWEEFTPTWTSGATGGSAVFNGKLYIGIAADPTGEIWRTDGITWEQVVPDGFGDADVYWVNDLVVFSGYLYGVTFDGDGNLQIYRSDSGDSGDWEAVEQNAFGGAYTTWQDKVFGIYDNHIYVGLSRDGVGELWRSENGLSWTTVFTDGLAANNTSISAIEEFNGELYIGLRNVVDGAEVWRSNDGLAFTPVVTGGFGNAVNARPYGLKAFDGALYLSIGNLETGVNIWKSTNGIDWTPTVMNGWGDSNNTQATYCDKGVTVFNDSLFFATWNTANGSEVWQMLGNDVYLPLVTKDYASFHQSAGILDTDFDEDGKVTTDFNGNGDSGYAIAIQPDGKIVLGGSSYGNTYSDFALARYLPDGSLDTTFGGDGKVTTDFWGSSDSAGAITLQSDGKILLGGYAFNGTNIDFALARYLSDGSLDTTFDGDGLITTDFDGHGDYATVIALQPDGKIILGGSSSSSGSTYNFALARYNSDGSLDAAFDGDGMVTTDFYGSDDSVMAITLLPDGKIVLGGYAYNNSIPDFALARYLSDGSLDTTFGVDGKVTTDFFGFSDYAYAIALQQDGKIILAGKTTDGVSEDFALARYLPGGSLDTTFSSDGLLTTDFYGFNDQVYTVALQPDGKTIVGGKATDGVSEDFALVRYYPDGTLDATFGSDGLLVTDFYGGDDSGQAIVIQPDGKVIIAGLAYNGSDDDFALVRYK